MTITTTAEPIGRRLIRAANSPGVLAMNSLLVTSRKAPTGLVAAKLNWTSAQAGDGTQMTGEVGRQ